MRTHPPFLFLMFICGLYIDYIRLYDSFKNTYIRDAGKGGRLGGGRAGGGGFLVFLAQSKENVRNGKSPYPVVSSWSLLVQRKKITSMSDKLSFFRCWVFLKPTHFLSLLLRHFFNCSLFPLYSSSYFYCYFCLHFFVLEKTMVKQWLRLFRCLKVQRNKRGRGLVVWRPPPPMALYDLSSGEVSWDPLSLGHYEGTHHHNHCYGMKYLLKPNSNLDLTAERFPKEGIAFSKISHSCMRKRPLTFVKVAGY